MAEQLRRSGKSYKAIFRQLNVPISTLASWFQKEPWSIKIRDRLASTESLAYPEKLKRLQETLKHKYNTLHESYRHEAIQEFNGKKADPVFVAGLMLYWGEGDHKIENETV